MADPKPNITEFIEKKNITDLSDVEHEFIAATIAVIRDRIALGTLTETIDKLVEYFKENYPDLPI